MHHVRIAIVLIVFTSSEHEESEFNLVYSGIKGNRVTYGNFSGLCTTTPRGWPSPCSWSPTFRCRGSGEAQGRCSTSPDAFTEPTISGDFALAGFRMFPKVNLRTDL